METSPIIIDEGRITIRPTDGTVWMTQHQIAHLFGVFVSAVGANIRSIIRSEVLREEAICHHQDTPNGGMRTLYNMEMITALAFRLKSWQAEQFRRWIVEQAINPIVVWKIPGTDAMLN